MPTEMSKEDYKKARGLYARFLDNFARIKTARFRVESKTESEDFPATSSSVEDVWWSPENERVESFEMEEGEVFGKRLHVVKGRDRWSPGVMRGRANFHFSMAGSQYLRRQELDEVQKRHSDLWERFTHCEFDDGSKGCSRLWNDKGEEVRFDTATGLLVEGRDTFEVITWKHQNIKGIWFPLEEQHSRERSDTVTKWVFSRVALNEPLDETLFAMPPLPPAWTRFKTWWHARRTRISRRDVDKVRALCERFLDNFARIETARFRLESREVGRDGKELTNDEADVVWVPRKQRAETWIYDKGERIDLPHIQISKDDEKWTWVGAQLPPLHEPPFNEEPGEYYMSFAGSHLAHLDFDWLRSSRGSYVLDLPNWEPDDGSTGFSRVLRPRMHELTFDTATGLLIEERKLSTARTFTYQQVNNIWFPHEIREFNRGWQQAEGPLTSRQIVSQVVLNEPVDERLFDLDRPFQAQQN
ncbi:MAG TPA: hypothetical protein VMZ06_15770 [Candidatus Bathyarchaeia archaeon]|nr:hypothetical protein [Candidatus Bathyarchaeia archaeon]